MRLMGIDGCGEVGNGSLFTYIVHHMRRLGYARCFSSLSFLPFFSQ